MASDELLTIAQARAYLKVGRNKLYEYMRAGDLAWYELKPGPGKKRGGRRFRRSDLDKLLRQMGG